MTDEKKEIELPEDFEREMDAHEDGQFDTKARKDFRRFYFKKLVDLQIEIIHIQEWARKKGKRVVVIFEGRDAAGKGGVIKRITQRTDPSVFKIVALPIPTKVEKGQWYFQRFVRHLPTKGQVVLFDRSWYNRGGVERVMHFCTKKQVKSFYKDAPVFEKMLTDDGIILIKFWFAISAEEQQFRFKCRHDHVIKQWKLSKVDKGAQARWDDYTEAKEDIFKHTSTSYAPWIIVPGDDKKRARLNCMQHLVSTINREGRPKHKITKLKCGATIKVQEIY